MRTIGFRYNSSQAMPKSAISPDLINSSTDRQIVKIANKHIRDAVSALREARRKDDEERMERTIFAINSLRKAASQYYVLRESNPKGSNIAAQAYQAEIRVERWMRRLAGASRPVDFKVSLIETGHISIGHDLGKEDLGMLKRM